uniref:RNA polymerase I associated factor, A49-like protein n=1 Tax=Panagrolaimus sp. ES5 TaxID=591445 RepID=A0AC34F208_9BILA
MGKSKDNGDIEIEEVESEAPVIKKKRRQTDINGAADQPSSSRPNGLRHTLNPSDFNELGFETESDHVIAVMDHFRLKESETPQFTEHVYHSKKKIYSFKNKAAPTVTFMGKEKIDEDDNYDYCLAIYNRRTKELEYKPISLLRFEGIPNIDPELLTGKEIKKRVNYAADHSIKQETLVDRRRQLTTQFGSEKKNKMLEATLRRQINDDTLTTLSKSTFESKNVVIKAKDEDSKAFETAESSVLPPANRTATVPAEIYPLSLFYTEFELQSFGKISQDFFKKNNVMAKLTALGVPKLVAEVALKVMSKDQKSEVEYYLVLQLIIMSIFVQQMAANKRTLQASEFDNFPSAIFHHIRDFYFKEDLKSNARWGYTHMERDKFVAWFLCLYLILNEFRIAITPLSAQLHLSEQQSGKTLSALGCVLSTATAEESTRYDTTRMARLSEPPSDKRLRKRRRGAAPGGN